MRNIVVIDIDNLHALVYGRVVIDQTGGFIDQFNDPLGAEITRSGFGAKNERAGRQIGVRMIFEQKILIQDKEGIQQLPLIFVQSFDLDVKKGIRINRYAHFIFHVLSQTHLVVPFDVHQSAQNIFVIGQMSELGKLAQIADPIFAARQFGQHRRQLRIAQPQPSSWRHTVGFVVEFIRPNSIKAGHYGPFQNVGVHGGHPVDGKSNIRGQPSHPDFVFANRRQLIDFIGTQAGLAGFLAKLRINASDDLQQPRKQELVNGQVPFFQSFAQNRMIRIGKNTTSGSKSILPRYIVRFGQNPDQFRNGDRRMGIIDLDDVQIRQAAKILPMIFDVTGDDALQ